MSDAAVPLESTPALSQPMRVVDTFVAPSKTFADILRSASCWLPLVIIFVMCAAWGFAIDKTVGYDTVVQVQMQKSPAQAERMQNMPADQRAHTMAAMTMGYRYSTYASGIFIIIGLLIEALVLWPVFNFGLGAKTTFPKVFATVSYAALPRTIFVLLLSMVLLFAGVGTENFDMKNPVGTNLGYYLSDAPVFLQSLGKSLDVFGFWSLALVILGMAIITKKKVSTSAIVILTLFVLVALITAGATAAFS